jgi:hypothetical protein
MKTELSKCCHGWFLQILLLVWEPDFPSVSLIFIHSTPHIFLILGNHDSFIKLVTTLAIEIQQLSHFAIKWH